MGKAAKAEDLDRTGTLGPVLDEASVYAAKWER
jgi:hypothetical protein